MQPPNPERRKAKRTGKPFVLRLQKASGSATDEWSFIFVKDVSKSCVSFRTNDEFGEGELYNIRLSVSRHSPPIQCRGEVLRVQPLKNGEHFFEVALVFVDLSPQDEEILERVIEEDGSNAAGG